MGQRILLLCSGLNRDRDHVHLWHGLLEALRASGHEPVFGAVGDPIGKLDRLRRASPSLEDLLSEIGPDSVFDVTDFKRSQALLVAIDRVVIVMPASPADWYALGLVTGIHQGRLKLGVMMLPEGAGPMLELPVVLRCSTLVTDDIERVIDWCNGVLFTNLLGGGGRKVRPPARPKEH
jgi:hypothetical protein